MREYLKNLRLEREEKQQTTAKALNISQNYYSQIENGIKQKKIDLELLIKISDHFGIPLQEIVAHEVEYRAFIEAAEANKKGA